MIFSSPDGHSAYQEIKINNHVNFVQKKKKSDLFASSTGIFSCTALCKLWACVQAITALCCGSSSPRSSAARSVSVESDNSNCREEYPAGRTDIKAIEK